MAHPAAALDAIKELQTILDDERDAIAGGTHLKLCNAALAVYNEVKAFAREKRKREDEDEGDDEEPASDDLDDDDEEEEDRIHGDDVDEDSLSGHELFRRWTRMLNEDGGDLLFDRMLRNLMGRAEVDSAIEEHELDHAKRRAAAWAIDKAMKNELEMDDGTWITSDYTPSDGSVAKIKEWVHTFVTDGALLYCIEVLDNGERGSSPEETGIDPDQDPRLPMLNILNNFCAFDVAFRRKLATARGLETIKYMAVHRENDRLRNMAAVIFLHTRPYNPDLEGLGGQFNFAAQEPVPRKKLERDMEIDELSEIWSRQVLEEVRSLYDVIEFTDDNHRTDKEHVAAFMAMGRVLVSAREPLWSEHLLRSAMFHMQKTGADAVVRTLQQGFHWDEHPEHDPRLAALTALMAAFNAPWLCLRTQKRVIVKCIDFNNGRRFLRETIRKHGAETRLGKLCHLVSQELAAQEQASS